MKATDANEQKLRKWAETVQIMIALMTWVTNPIWGQVSGYTAD